MLMKRISRLLNGDRVLVERMQRPAKSHGLHIPESYSHDGGRSRIWWGKVLGFGLDTRCKEAFGLKEGDIVGINPIAKDCHTFIEDGIEYSSVPEEFIEVKDEGLVSEVYNR